MTQVICKLCMKQKTGRRVEYGLISSAPTVMNSSYARVTIFDKAKFRTVHDYFSRDHIYALPHFVTSKLDL